MRLFDSSHIVFSPLLSGYYDWHTIHDITLRVLITQFGILEEGIYDIRTCTFPTARQNTAQLSIDGLLRTSTELTHTT